MPYYEYLGFCLSVAFSIGLLIGAGIAWALVMKWEPIHAVKEETM